MSPSILSTTSWMAACAVLLLAPDAGAQGQVLDPGGHVDPRAPPTREPGELSDCHTFDFHDATTTWSRAVDVPRFDPALGVLDRIEITLSARIRGSARVESLDAQETDSTLRFSSTVTLSKPRGGAVLVTLNPLRDFTDHLMPFDGAIDFAGPSGATHDNIVVNLEGQPIVMLASERLFFTGEPNDPGTVRLVVTAAGDSMAEGGGNLVTQFQQSAGASFTVCYVFEPDCNQNGLPDAEDISVGTASDADQNGIPDGCSGGMLRICFGDGAQNGGPGCPCGNSTPLNTGGCLNSTGLGATIDGTGTPRVSQDTFVLVGSNMPAGSPAIFLQATSTVNNDLGAIFGAGLLCIGPSPERMGVIAVGGTGQARFPLPGESMAEKFQLRPGDRRSYQIWYRDTQGPCESTTLMYTTNGLIVVWGS